MATMGLFALLRRLRLPRGLRGIKLAPEKQLEPGDDV